MSFKLPSLSNIITALGGAAGIAGVICTLVGVTPSSTVGTAVEGAVSGLLVLIAHWHATSTVAKAAQAKATTSKAAPTTV